MRTRARALRRFSARRSSSLRPPQTPWSCPASRAHCEALLAHLAASAHLLGLLDLEDGRTGVADREEQLRVLVEARGTVTPIHGWASSFSRHCGATVRAAGPWVVGAAGHGSGHDATTGHPCSSRLPRIVAPHKGYPWSRGSQVSGRRIPHEPGRTSAEACRLGSSAVTQRPDHRAAGPAAGSRGAGGAGGAGPARPRRRWSWPASTPAGWRWRSPRPCSSCSWPPGWAGAPAGWSWSSPGPAGRSWPAS